MTIGRKGTKQIVALNVSEYTLDYADVWSVAGSGCSRHSQRGCVTRFLVGKSLLSVNWLSRCLELYQLRFHALLLVSVNYCACVINVG